MNNVIIGSIGILIIFLYIMLMLKILLYDDLKNTVIVSLVNLNCVIISIGIESLLLIVHFVIMFLIGGVKLYLIFKDG